MEKQKPKAEREAIKAKKREQIRLVKLIDENNTIMITYTTSIPSSQLQKIRKKLSNTSVKVMKKGMIIRAFEGSKKEKVKELINYLNESSAVMFSNLDPFDLASLLAEYRYPMKAKVGQISPEDIMIEEGPTELMPGPVISEFGAVGIKVGIVGGKVAVKESKAIVKKGNAITKPVSDILSKLDIKPFKIGLTPVAAYDSKNNAIYHDIIIDKEKTTEKLKEMNLNGLKLAIYAAYPAREIMGQLLAKASSHASALQGKIGKKSEETKQDNTQPEQKQEEQK